MSKTIYYYGIDNNYGGMENYAFNLIKGILSKDSSISFHVISMFNDYAYRDELEAMGVSSSIVPNKRKHPFKYIKEIRKILINHNEDDFIQINQMSYSNFLLYKAIKKSNIKVLVVAHGAGIPGRLHNIIHNIGKKKYINIGNKLAVSTDASKFMFNNTNNVSIIPNGIDSNRFIFNKEYREEIRSKYNIANDTFAIGFIGRLSKLKNPLFAVQVMELLLDNPNIQLYMFGKEEDPYINEYISSRELSNVHILGESKETYKIYSALDMFIFPSIHESQGISLYEALANGLKCIVSPNIPLVKVEQNNITILELNSILWARYILDNLNIDYPRINLIKDSQYELDNQIDKYIDLYKNI